MRTPDTISQLAHACVTAENTTGVPAELSFAQAAIESGWLEHAPGNNCHGIKAGPGQRRQLLRTTEYFTPAQLTVWRAGDPAREVLMDHGAGRYTVRDWFRAYDSLDECIADHGRLISTGKPYAKAWAAYQSHRDWRRLLRDIAPIYATAPNYEAQVLAVVDATVVQAIEKARQA